MFLVIIQQMYCNNYNINTLPLLLLMIYLESYSYQKLNNFWPMQLPLYNRIPISIINIFEKSTPIMFDLQSYNQTDNFASLEVFLTKSDLSAQEVGSFVNESDNRLNQNAKGRKKNPKCAPYYWSDYENKKYAQFLKESGWMLLLPPKQRKEQKVNLKMSRKIKTRNYVQCRTHHQKMMEKYGSIEAIIESFRSLFEQKGKLDGSQAAQQKSQSIEPAEDILRQHNWKTVDQILADQLLPFCPLMDSHSHLFGKNGYFSYQNFEEDDIFQCAQW